ncbi:hypothetical protein NE865_03645 [Phthorimaea operculella]|nr:hypothetical protein NE865_03645 [Phthorimaea operculella]
MPSRGSRSPPRSPPRVFVQPAPRRSLFRDSAAIAGGVTVGTAAGHVVGEGISRLFGSGSVREREVIRELPPDYQPGSRPSGPCAYEIGQFVNCAEANEDLSQCQYYKDLLRTCKKQHGIP